MKRYIARFVVLLLLACLLAGCTGASMPPAAPQVTTSIPVAEAPATAGIALVTTQQKLDSEFGQLVWNTLSQFAGKNNYKLATYKTEENVQEAAVATLELAVQGGAVLVVGMDNTISDAMAQISNKYFEADFMLFDASPFQALYSNVVSFQFSHAQAGWLAGYVAMREARGSIGLVSGEDDSSMMYSLGYMLGADAAAKAISLEPLEASVVQLTLTGGIPASSWQGEITGLYSNDVDIVFCSMPAAQRDTLLAATYNYNWAIGFQTTPAKSMYGVLASIDFNPQPILQTQLDLWHGGSFEGGMLIQGDVQNQSIWLAYEAESFAEVGAATLARVTTLLANEDTLARIAQHTQKNTDGSWPTSEELQLEFITVRTPTNDDGVDE